VTTKVIIVEATRGWARKIIEEIKFPTKDEAEVFIKEYNSKNTFEGVPELYRYAMLDIRHAYTRDRKVDILEVLSSLEHDQWVSWSKDISAKEDITAECLSRWEQSWVPYSELTEEMKEANRDWARKTLKALANAGWRYSLG